MAGHACRCRGCGARNTLKHPLDWYKRTPRCRACGKPALRRDKWMDERNTRAMTCHCDGYHFPHRLGSKWCQHFQGALTDADHEARYYALPRAGAL